MVIRQFARLHHQFEASVGADPFQNASSGDPTCDAVIIFGHRLEHLLAAILTSYRFGHFVQFAGSGDATAKAEAVGVLLWLECATCPNASSRLHNVRCG